MSDLSRALRKSGHADLAHQLEAKLQGSADSSEAPAAETPAPRKTPEQEMGEGVARRAQRIRLEVALAMTPRKRSAHSGLECHNQRVAEANAALREAQADERRAASAVEVARDAVREAHDLGADPAEATAALGRIKADAEQAVLALEGMEQRVRRAVAEREDYLAENGQTLLAELTPACEQAGKDLRARSWPTDAGENCPRSWPATCARSV